MAILLFRSAPVARLAAWSRTTPERPRVLLAQEGLEIGEADWFEEVVCVPSGPIRPDRWAGVLPAIRRIGADEALVPMTDWGHGYRGVLATALAAGVRVVRAQTPDRGVRVWSRSALERALAAPPPVIAPVVPPAGTEVVFLANEGSEAPLIETRVFRYLEPLARAGRRILLVTPEATGPDGALARPDEVARRRAALPAGLVWAPVPIRGGAVGAVDATLRAASRALAGRARAIHARAFPAMRAAARLRAAGGPRWIADPRGLWPEEAGLMDLAAARGRRAAPLAAAFRSALRRADRAIAVGEAMARALREAAPAVPVAVVRNAADAGRFRLLPPAERAAARRALRLPGGLLLVHAGGTGRYQAIDRVLDVYAAARAVRPDAGLLLLTHEEGETAIEAARRAGLAGGVVSARVSPDEVGRFLAAADIGLVLRPRGGGMDACMPTKAAEFLASGLPLLFSPHVEALTGLARGVGVPIEAEGPVPAEAIVAAVRLAVDEAVRSAARARAEELWRTDGPEALGRIYDSVVGAP